MLRPTVRHERNAIRDRWCGDDTPHRLVIRIKSAALPEQFPIRGAMTGQVIGAPRENLFFTFLANDSRCGVTLICFFLTLVLSSSLPGNFA